MRRWLRDGWNGGCIRCRYRATGMAPAERLETERSQLKSLLRSRFDTDYIAVRKVPDRPKQAPSCLQDQPALP